MNVRLLRCRDTHRDILYSARLAFDYWPNDGRDDNSPRELMRSAFRFIRNHLKAGRDLAGALVDLECDAYRYRDM